MNPSSKRNKKILLLSFLFVSIMVFSAFGALSTLGEIPSYTVTKRANFNTKEDIFLPHINSTKRVGVDINPHNLYSGEPAPMGLADYGIDYQCNGLVEKPYYYNTTSFLGTVSINSIDVVNNTTGSPWMTFQFNVNLVFCSGQNLYVYWMQDVAFLNTSDKEVYFIDNVWNISSPSGNMLTSSIEGNGTIGNSSGTHYYYDFANANLPGNCANLKYPSEMQLMMNSSITKNGIPEVAFMYNDGSGWVTYDNVKFSFVKDLTGDLGFVVDGFSYEPDGYSYYDAELILGGPGGGSSTTDINSNLNLSIQYWNGHNFQEISNAYNYGSDTAETIGNVISQPLYYTTNGSLFEQLTPGKGTLGAVYNSCDISILNIMTTLSSGTVYVNGGPHRFVNDDANLTLGSGTYNICIEQGSVKYDSFTVNLTAGEFKEISIYKSVVTFKESNLTGGTWYVNLSNNLKGSAAYGSTISFVLTNGSYTYTIATSEKIYHANGGSLKVTGQPISEDILFSEVKYSTTFTETGLPSETTWYVNLSNGVNSGAIKGATYEVMLPNGSYIYSIGTSNKTYHASSGSFRVDGGIEDVFLTFTVEKYNITFTESGLPAGITWHVNGSMTNHALSGSTIIFSLVNGTYKFSVTNTTDYYTITTHFTFKVNGHDLSETVTYDHYSYITGKISPDNATVSINGKMIKLSSSGTFNTTVTSGSYYIIVSENGYRTYYDNMTLTNGRTQNIDANLTKVSSSTSISNSDVYAIVGVIGVLVVIGVTVALMRRKR